MRLRNVALAWALLGACSGSQQPLSAKGKDTASGTLLIANKRGNSLTRIDLATGSKTHEVRSCANPHELAVSPDRRHVALACYSGQELEIFRTADLVLVKRIDLGERARPHGVVWHSNGTLIAGAEGRGSLVVVDRPLTAEPEMREIGGGATGPHLVAVDRAGRFAWGTIIPSGTVVRYDLAEGKETTRKVLGGLTEGIALSPDGRALWVGANQSSKVYRLDPATLAVKSETATGAVPIRVAAHPNGKWVVTSNFAAGTLSVIDASTDEVARAVPVSGKGSAAQVTLVFSGDGLRLYAAETNSNTIAEVDFASGTILRHLPSGDGGDGLAVFK
jgi:DNA-binding beta-propeller fold protein YncE